MRPNNQEGKTHMKLRDLCLAIFLCVAYMVLSAVIHGELLKADFMYCIGVSLGYMLGAYQVRAEFRRLEADKATSATSDEGG